MKATLIVAALLLVCASTFAQESPSDSKVIHLTRDNITNAAYVPGVVIVLFFAPWCPHCQAFRPTYEKFAKQAAVGVIVGDVDCTQQPYLQDEFGVLGYPTVFAFFGGEYFQYNGPRTVSALNNFAGGAYKFSQAKPLPTITPTPVPVVQYQVQPTQSEVVATQQQQQPEPVQQQQQQPQPTEQVLVALPNAAKPAEAQAQNSSRTLYNLLVGTVILLVAGAAAYFYYGNDGKASPKDLLKLKITKYFSYEQNSSDKNSWANDDAFIRPELA